MPPENDEPIVKSSAEGPGELHPPPSLLPDLLRRLGLEKGQEAVPQVTNLVADLKHPAWYVRAAAVRELGKLGEQASPALILAALDDPHVSVRANAVLALGALGERAPVEQLVQALLLDSEWQVRESAALALETLGKFAPGAPLLAALHDPDIAVRQAASRALEQTYPELLAPDLSLPSKVPVWRFTNALTKSWQVLRPMLRHGHTVNSYIYEKEENMHETDFHAETTSYLNGKSSQPEPPQRSKHPLWRTIGLGVAVAVVIINLLAWTLLTHTFRHSTQTGGVQVAHGSSPTNGTTSSQAGPLGKTLFTYPAHGTAQDDFMSVGWSADGKYISVSGFDIKLLNAHNGQVVKTFDEEQSSVWANWSPDGTRLATSSQVVRIWDIKTGQVLATYTPKPAQASISTSQGNPMARLSGGNMVYDSAWSSDGKFIASAVNGNAYGFNVQVWNAATGAYVRTLQVKANATVDDYISQVAWSPDGRYIAASSPNNGVIVWDASTGQHVYTRQGASVMTWAPQGDLIASANSAGRVQVWQAATGAVQFSFQGQTGANGVAALAWSPNGKLIAASGQDVRIWDVTDNKLHYIYTGHGKPDAQNIFSISSLAWSPDSTEIASMEQGMHLITSHTGTLLDSVRVWIAA